MKPSWETEYLSLLPSKVKEVLAEPGNSFAASINPVKVGQ